jgi:capsular exopolysaccharide synthesis family protein
VPNPEVAALLANATVKAYVEEVFRMKMDSARRTLEWMTKKAQEEGKELEKTEKVLQEYMKENNLLALEDRRIGVPEQLSQLSTDFIIAQSKRKQLESLYNKVRKVAGNPEAAVTIPAVAGDRALQELRGQILMTEKSIMELSAKYGRKHPVMIKAYGDLRVLRNKEKQEIHRIVQTIKNDYELALSNEHNLESQIQTTNADAHLLNEKFIQYGVLKRDVDTSRQMFDSLMLKLKEQSITQENQAVDVWIVEEAIPPKYPISPRKAMNLFLGLVLGLSGGIAFAFFAEYLDNTVKDPEDVERAFDIPVLGVVELWKSKGKSLESIVIKEPYSRLAECYRGLRTAIQLSFPDQPPKKLLVTSSSMQEGKTTTAANLALSLAQSNSRVLLIEGDLRKPRIHKVFNLDNTIGLSNYLAGAVEGHIIQKGPVPNLALIPSGPIPPNPSELLVSNRMKVLLDSVSKEFDFIVCDTAPLLPVADPRILGRLFDGVILVSRAGKTTYDQLERSLKILNDTGARFLGLVINAHDVKKSGYYHQSYYDYYESPETEPEAPKGKPGVIHE